MLMNPLKSLLIAAMALAAALPAQTPPAAPAPFIKGDLRVIYATRTQPGKEGVVDTYTLNVNVANSAVFKGTITHRPFIQNTMSSNQTGQLTYAVDMDVLNPANPSQSRSVGKLSGNVPIDAQNVYRFTQGNLTATIFGAGTAKGFESKFGGLALGKPPATSGMAKLSQDALRMVSSKGAISVTKYDKMTFENHVIAAGPVQTYPETVWAGAMVYDYNRTAWYFQNVTVSYTVEGRQMRDTITGNVRWVEAADRKTSGAGEYQVDIHVNEPAPTEASVFAGPQDESAFFAVDASTPALTGTIKFKDALQGGTVVSATAQIDLNSVKLTKAQVMYLGKALFLTALVPFCAE